jgi:Fic family protein
MDVREQLILLQKLSGLTQTQLAARLGVTFAALNRWVNGKAIPRPKTRERIDTLYKEYSGEKQIPETALDAKKQLIAAEEKKHANVLRKILDNPDIRDRFYLSLTYNSNRIEGSTLSEGETAAILFEHAALPDKSLIEQLEAKNHQAALQHLFAHMDEKKLIHEALILKLHSILMNAVRTDAGLYRNHAVRIMGAHVPTANHQKIPALMKELARDIAREKTDPIAHIAEIHSRFESIHPFSDGNGRVGRLLMHAMALRANLAPAVILQEQRRIYIAYLQKAQLKDDSSLLQDLVCDAILEGYRIVDRAA